ncbi:MAG: FAD-dependent oxidoreductase, partial [Planctomycetaceae bacterium]|nr:FAD-dependent oxidoreductase [Planctomycetaceae bacterium]
MDVDVLIIGGGIAGLWTLDQLRRSGYRAVLVENRALGFGQTITSQGIIHGGLKYSLRGILTASANEIREMPGVWRGCLSGQQSPDLSQAMVRSHSCYLWQTAALSSQAGMFGAQMNLQVKPEAVANSKRPELLQQAPGNVYRLDEQVISPASVLECLRKRNQNALLLCDQQQGLEFSRLSTGRVDSVTIRHQGKEVSVAPGCVVMTAGVGNELLASSAGRKQAMQRRPLQMVMARGKLPMFQGHCVDGAKTRVT